MASGVNVSEQLRGIPLRIAPQGGEGLGVFTSSGPSLVEGASRVGFIPFPPPASLAYGSSLAQRSPSLESSRSLQYLRELLAEFWAGHHQH